jgi:hypothetical protein
MGAWVLILIYVIVICVPVAFYGKDRPAGFWGTLVVSVFLSPIVGILYARFLKEKDHGKMKRELLRDQYEQMQKRKNTN